MQQKQTSGACSVCRIAGVARGGQEASAWEQPQTPVRREEAQLQRYDSSSSCSMNEQIAPERRRTVLSTLTTPCDWIIEKHEGTHVVLAVYEMKLTSSFYYHTRTISTKYGMIYDTQTQTYLERNLDGNGNAEGWMPATVERSFVS